MIASEIISEKELLAIRFYMGDPAVVDSGQFHGGPKAYNTINALLHPGTGNEKDKVREGRVIELENSSHLKSYIELILDIYRAMEKYRKSHGAAVEGGWCAYRIDRASSLIRFEQNHHMVAGFFSTCKWGFLPAYARSKANIVLLEVQRDETVPFLDFSELFGEDYAKPEEAEILLPFGIVLQEMEPLAMTEQEMQTLRDMNGNPPRGKWRIRLTLGQMPEIPKEELAELYAEVTKEDNVTRIKECMEKMSAGKSLTLDEEQFYCTWKIQLHQYIGGCIDAINHVS